MKIMQRKLSKSLLVSVLALIMVGSAAAAFIWISNMRTTIVTVRVIPITLAGDFIDSPYLSEETLQIFNFTVNDVDNAVGYIFIQFNASGQTFNMDDIEVRAALYYDVVMYPGYLMPGYPINTTGQLTFMFSNNGLDLPFDFGLGGADLDGAIYVWTTYHVEYVVEASIRITSTSS